MSESRWNENCEIVERITIEADLILDTPAHFGNGDVDSLMDMPVLRDPIDQTFVLTGSSISGALRAHLEKYGDKGAKIAKTLFGGLADTVADESALVIYDARSKTKTSELRDNVRLDSTTRSAVDGGKFDMEVIEAGSRFAMRFDLHRRKDEEIFLSALGFALAGLQGSIQKLPNGKILQHSGEIGLGKRKTRGFGYCHAVVWRVRRYDMTKFDDLLAWIKDDRSGATEYSDIQSALGNLKRTAGSPFLIHTTLRVDGSMLIRADGSTGGNLNAPDAVHLKSKRGDAFVPVISGTALAGALRARATRIAKTISPANTSKAIAVIEKMFGTAKAKKEWPDEQDSTQISRLRVRECVIEDSSEYAHTRVKIDRFTGGAFPSGLFTEQPVFGKPDNQTQVNVTLELRDASNAEIGLLLLLFKDLWTGDLPLGGERSVGRGWLKGITASLSYGDKVWSIDAADPVFKAQQPGETTDDLKNYVIALATEVK